MLKSRRTISMLLIGFVVITVAIGVTIKRTSDAQAAEEFAISASHARSIAQQMGCSIVAGPSRSTPVGSAWTNVCDHNVLHWTVLHTFPSHAALQSYMSGSSTDAPNCQPLSPLAVVVGTDWVVNGLDSDAIQRAMNDAGGTNICAK